MKLIYAKGTCAFSVHLLLEELGIRYDTEIVSLKDKAALLTYNTNGYVPVLQLDNGHILTEAVAILQFLAETRGSGKFLPTIGSIERADCLKWLVYTSTELHQKMAPLFHKETVNEEFQKMTEEKLGERLSFMDKQLEGKTYLLGETYSIADMYALAILRLFEHVDFSLSQYKNITRFKDMMEGMPVVVKLTRAEEKDAEMLNETQVDVTTQLPSTNLDEYTLSHH